MSEPRVVEVVTVNETFPGDALGRTSWPVTEYRLSQRAYGVEISRGPHTILVPWHRVRVLRMVAQDPPKKTTTKKTATTTKKTATTTKKTATTTKKK